MYDIAILYSNSAKLQDCRKMGQGCPSGVARNDGGRCRRQPRDDGLAMWPGSGTRPRDWSRVLVKSLRRLSSELQVSYSTRNGISTSGTCKFARDGSSYAIRITEMDMGLYFCEEWYMTVSSPFSVLTSPSTAWGMFIISLEARISFYPIDRLPAHQREVKITTVTPALDEFYRFHSVIVEQIGQSICHILDSVLVLSDVRVTDEVFNSSSAFLASERDKRLGRSKR
ncbi:hypothetical protein BU17DRAFT_71714 [Hysterangium stoloniferum]|nr:hypothetical protein BU17DRAFT_71714 [Hysterangium stoloniferum]